MNLIRRPLLGVLGVSTLLCCCSAVYAAEAISTRSTVYMLPVIVIRGQGPRTTTFLIFRRFRRFLRFRRSEDDGIYKGKRPLVAPLGLAAGARLPGLCCRGYAAGAMLQGLCCRCYAAGAMLQGLCRGCYAADHFYRSRAPTAEPLQHSPGSIAPAA